MSSSLITLISLLRGINVGGHSKISMHALRGVYEGIGLGDPYTYLQSGNVVFRTKEQHLVRLAERIEIAIEQKFRFRPPVLLRSCSALRDVMARNPFAKHGIEASKLLVMFLATEPDPETRNQLRKIDSGHEKLEIDGRELYLYLPRASAGPRCGRCWKEY